GLPPRFFLFIGLPPPAWAPSIAGLVRALEGEPFYWFFGVLFLFVYIALSFIFLCFWCLWRKTQRLLQHLSCQPMLPPSQSLRTEYLQTPRIALSNLSRSLSVLEFSVEQAGLVARSANQTGPLLFKEKPLEDRVNRLANRAKSHLSALKDEEAK